jgi:symplekin
VDDDDDDYEPDFQIAEDTEQILNKLDSAPAGESPLTSTEVPLGPFMLPAPEPMSKEEVEDVAQDAVLRLFGVMASVDEPASKGGKAGVNRLAASNNDREAWITLITRLASRAPAGLEVSGTTKAEIESSGAQQRTISDTIREALYLYIVEDFRRRIDVAVAWLCEEWYSDRIQSRLDANACFHYDKWALRILDGIVPYLDARDKFLTRFLSEIPALNMEMFERVKGLCRDPAMINLALTSLLYLVMMRPPAREMALDTVEDVWRTCE